MIQKASEQSVETRKNMRGGPGSVTLKHCFKSGDFGAEMRLCARLILPPGAGIGLHEHAAEDEVYYILNGTATLDEGQGPVEMQPGDAILTGRGAKHAIENRGKEDLEIFAFIATYPKT
jgi:mannose-6-phosphate isomerase-like protein (cupin superfamily)